MILLASFVRELPWGRTEAFQSFSYLHQIPVPSNVATKFVHIWGTRKHFFQPPPAVLDVCQLLCTPQLIRLWCSRQLLFVHGTMIMVIMCCCVPAGCMFVGNFFGCSEARGSLPHFCVTVLWFGCRFAEHSSCLWAPSFTILVARLPFLVPQGLFWFRPWIL